MLVYVIRNGGRRGDSDSGDGGTLSELLHPGLKWRHFRVLQMFGGGLIVRHHTFVKQVMICGPNHVDVNQIIVSIWLSRCTEVGLFV